MREDDLAPGVDDESHVEEAVLEIGVAGLGLGHDEGVVLLGDVTQELRLLPGDVDGALSRELDMIQVEHLVVEALERALREGDEPHGDVEAGQPGGGLHQMREVVQIDLDVLALADPPNGGNEADGGIRLDHARAPLLRSGSASGLNRKRRVVNTGGGLKGRGTVKPLRLGACVMPLENRRDVLVGLATQDERMGYEVFFQLVSWAYGNQPQQAEVDLCTW